MILHIIDDEKFLVSAITLFETIYPGENVFLVGVDKKGFNNYEELKELTKIVFKKVNTLQYNHEYLSFIKTANLVLFHNVYKTYKLELLNKDIIDAKTAWFFWGAELYGLNPFYNALLPRTKKAYFKSLPLKIYLKKVIFSNFKKHYYWYIFKKVLKQNKLNYTLTNITEDIDLLESYTNHKTKRGWFTYYSYNQKFKIEINNASKKHILIGNSSSETNNHLDAFHLIKDKEITDKKIYIPLNYGDERYRDLVVKQAATIFKEQAKPITDFLSLESYTSIIKSCAVLLMNHKRQQAFNTIMMALANGCKVFMREENTIFKMLKREGFLVFSIQKDINNTNAFEALAIEEQRHNLKLIEETYSKNNVLSRIKGELEEILNE
jgi:dTDP-N-acetylfucosamine:lipid II N-acetylfucosaminyltransferase